MAKIDGYNVSLSASELKEIAKHLSKNNWIRLKPKSQRKAVMTGLGFEKAEEINDGIFNHQQSHKLDWAYGADEDISDWLLVHGWSAFERGKPYMEKGMVNFREIANRYRRRVSDQQLHSALSDLEFKDMIQQDTGPSPGQFWANFNHGGEVAAKLLDQLWEARGRFPASDRFVKLDDNAPNYAAAISSLENLVSEMAKIRVNDWPEKEGMIATISGALSAIRTKYVNRTNILAAMSSVVTFVMVKFAEAPIVEIASTAWAAVKSLF